jgi:DNA-binding GntR family transcriptional regulator
MEIGVQDLKELRVDAQAAPLRRRVADNLRNAIIEGRFKPGERLRRPREKSVGLLFGLL